VQLPTGPRLSAGPDKPGTALQAVLDTMRVLVLDEGKKTGFLSHLYIKVIFLPRQARDKHRENSKKKPGFRSGGEKRNAALFLLFLLVKFS
jgi:hypothetical protein